MYPCLIIVCNTNEEYMYVYPNINNHLLVCVTNVILVQLFLYKRHLYPTTNYGKVNLMALFLKKKNYKV